jgi:hypothetical protein
MPVPDFSPGEVLTAAAMDSIGLWKIASVSVTSGNIIAVNNCFTSDYENYRIVMSNLKTTSNVSIAFQLRSGTTPATTGYAFGHAFVLFTSASWNITANAGTAANFIGPGNTSTNPPANGTIDLFQPQINQRTGMTGHYQSFDAFVLTSGSHNAGTNVYDGFQLNSGGTFTSGTVTVYGYRK